jgi:hypothetical protein
MFRHLSIATGFIYHTGILRTGHALRDGSPGGIDSYRRAPKMVAACRPEKAARFVFERSAVDAIAPMRA